MFDPSGPSGTRSRAFCSSPTTRVAAASMNCDEWLIRCLGRGDAASGRRGRTSGAGRRISKLVPVPVVSDQRPNSGLLGSSSPASRVRSEGSGRCSTSAQGTRSLPRPRSSGLRRWWRLVSRPGHASLRGFAARRRRCWSSWRGCPGLPRRTRRVPGSGRRGLSAKSGLLSRSSAMSRPSPGVSGAVPASARSRATQPRIWFSQSSGCRARAARSELGPSCAPPEPGCSRRREAAVWDGYAPYSENGSPEPRVCRTPSAAVRETVP